MSTQHEKSAPRITVDAETAAHLESLAESFGLKSRRELLALLKDFLPESREDYDAIHEAARILGKSVAEVARIGALGQARSIIARSKNGCGADRDDEKILTLYESVLTSERCGGDPNKVTPHAIRALSGMNPDKIRRVLDKHNKPYAKPPAEAEVAGTGPIETTKKRKIG